LLLYRWRGEARNFGDELNTLLWPRLLPDLLDDNPDALLLGIGSVLDARHDNAVTKVVAGAGYGGYAQPATLDASWVIHWVRGPRTAVGFDCRRRAVSAIRRCCCRWRASAELMTGGALTGDASASCHISRASRTALGRKPPPWPVSS
jgi:hypothetical protein